MDGKSIMGILLLSASQGSEITISADGTDEVEAVNALRALVERGFDEAPFAQGSTFGGTRAGFSARQCGVVLRVSRITARVPRTFST